MDGLLDLDGGGAGGDLHHDFPRDGGQQEVEDLLVLLNPGLILRIGDEFVGLLVDFGICLGGGAVSGSR